MHLLIWWRLYPSVQASTCKTSSNLLHLAPTSWWMKNPTFTTISNLLHRYQSSKDTSPCPSTTLQPFACNFFMINQSCSNFLFVSLKYIVVYLLLFIFYAQKLTSPFNSISILLSASLFFLVCTQDRLPQTQCLFTKILADNTMSQEVSQCSRIPWILTWHCSKTIYNL